MSELTEHKRYGTENRYVLYWLRSDYETEFDLPENSTTDKEVLEWALNRFDEEYNCLYNKVRYPSRVLRLSEWLQGIPLSFDYMYSDIAQIGKDWGYIHENDPKSEEKFLGNWWKYIARRILACAEICGIDTSKY